MMKTEDVNAFEFIFVETIVILQHLYRRETSQNTNFMTASRQFMGYRQSQNFSARRELWKKLMHR